jgi:hypothetical protein
MPPDHRRRIDELDPRRVTVQLSPRVRNAFANLAAAVHFSDTFDPGMLQTVSDLAVGKAMSVDDLIGSLPPIAEHTFNHIHATGDERARKAWQEIGHALLEEGFTLVKSRGRAG